LVAAPARCIEREVVVDLDPAAAIHEALRRRPHSVACMATHGRGRSAALWGSVANDVIARGHDPLILVGPFVDAERSGEQVIACVDESPESLVVLPAARRWAELLGERMAVLTVAEPVPDPIRPGPPQRRFGPGDVEGFLNQTVAPLRAEGHDVATLAVYDPITPADGVCGYLEEHPAALVVVGSHARSGVARLALGSVAAGIVHRSVSPVLVVCRPAVCGADTAG
jgi:nucleotide-binding universal stress UspA family protein